MLFGCYDFKSNKTVKDLDHAASLFIASGRWLTNTNTNFKRHKLLIHIIQFVGPVIFRFKKSNFPFQKKLIPFRFRFIIGNVEFDEITIYRKKVRWTDRQNGTISAVNWRKITQLARWTEEKGHY